MCSSNGNIRGIEKEEEVDLDMLTSLDKKQQFNLLLDKLQIDSHKGTMHLLEKSLKPKSREQFQHMKEIE